MPNRTLASTKTRAVSPPKSKRGAAATRAKGTAIAGKAPVRIFVSYSHKDPNAQEQLEVHLAVLKRDGVSTWFDGDMHAGDALDDNISRELRKAHIFVALFSPDYLHSDYCWRLEYKRAMGRRARGTMHVVVVVVRPCDWRSTQAARFKLLPKDGRAVSKWRSMDEAYLDVVGGLRGVVAAYRKEQAAVVAAKPPRRIPAPKKKVTAKPRAAAVPARTKRPGTKVTAKPKMPPRKSR